jgi:hypothetical protein
MKMSDNFEKYFKAKCSKYEVQEGRNLFSGICQRVESRRNKNKVRNLISGIAASILLVVGMYFGLRVQNIEPNNTTSFAQIDREQSNFASVQEESIEVNAVPSTSENDKEVSTALETEVVLLSEYRGQVLVLPDQSKVTLEKGASISYNSQFGIENRKITFSGTAYFEVQPDKRKPFIIETPNSLTKVVGTSFNLISNTEMSDCIAVTSGIVEFGNKRSSINKRLTKGNIAKIDHVDIVVSQYSNSNFLSWKTGLLIFESAALKDIIPVVSQYFDKEFNLKNSALENCTFSGKFESPNLNDFLEIMSLSLNIEYTIEGDQVTFSGIGCDKD